MTNQNSKCCGSSVTAISSDEGTSYYQCNRCLQPTDVVSKCCEKCINAPKCKHGCVLRHFHCENCPCHTTSKSEGWCEHGLDKFGRKECFDSASGIYCPEWEKNLCSGTNVATKPRLENWEKRLRELFTFRSTISPEARFPIYPGYESVESLISTLLQEERGKFINEIDETLKTVGDFSGEGFVSEDMKNFARITLNDLKVKMQQQ